MAGRADLGEYGWFHLASEPEVEAGQHAGQQRQRPHALAALPAAAAAPRGQAGDTRPWSTASTPCCATGSATTSPAGTPAATPGARRSTRASARRCWSAPPPARSGQQPWLLKALEEARRDDGRPRPLRGRQQRLAAPVDGPLRDRRDPAAGRPGGGSPSPASAPLRCASSTTTAPTRKARLTYAVNNYRWFRQAAERLRLAGDPVPPELLRTERIPGFIAARHPPRRPGRGARRHQPRPAEPQPTGPARRRSSPRPAAPAAPRRADTFASFAGGYVFGRSGWGASTRPLTDETFFSVRAGKATASRTRTTTPAR